MATGGMIIMNNKIKEYDNRLFKKNLEYLIKKNNTSKKDIQEELILGSGALTRYCNTEKIVKPSIEVIINLADRFDVTIDELIKTDLEMENRVKKESNETKEIIICNELINDTKSCLLNWTECDLTRATSNYGREENILEFSELLGYSEESNTNLMYASKFLNKKYELDNIQSFIAEINFDRVLITKNIQSQTNEEAKNFRYELYFITTIGETSPNDYVSEDYQNEILPVISSHYCKDSNSNIEFDINFYNNLKELYDAVFYNTNYGQQKFKAENIFNNYLESKKRKGFIMDENDIPF